MVIIVENRDFFSPHRHSTPRIITPSKFRYSISYEKQELIYRKQIARASAAHTIIHLYLSIGLNITPWPWNIS